MVDGTRNAEWDAGRGEGWPQGLPEVFRRVRYAGSRHPGAVPEAEGMGGPEAAPAGGANCRRYAYAVLAHFGLPVPALRSAELWADTSATVRAACPRPLDLVLFDAGGARDRPAGWGAHVGVHMGPDLVLHLCREVGSPAVWDYADFARRPRYRRLLGAKRVRSGTG